MYGKCVNWKIASEKSGNIVWDSDGEKSAAAIFYAAASVSLRKNRGFRIRNIADTDISPAERRHHGTAGKDSVSVRALQPNAGGNRHLKVRTGASEPVGRF